MTNTCPNISTCSNAVFCSASDAFIERFDNFGAMYRASTLDEFAGVGVVNFPYDHDTLNSDIRASTSYFSDQVFGEIREIKFVPGQTHSVAETTYSSHPP